MNIGLVEDSPALGEMLKAGLELSGNTVVLYECAQEAISAILLARFNGEPLPHEVLVTDLDLGQGVDGAELIRRVRQFLTPEELPIILLSGSDLIERQLLSQDHVRLLKKPLTPGTIDKAIKEEVSARSLPSEP